MSMEAEEMPRSTTGGQKDRKLMGSGGLRIRCFQRLGNGVIMLDKAGAPGLVL
jgi:hypothetical protein